MAAEEATQLILTEAERQLDRQADALNGVRTSGAAIVTSASVVAAVFTSVLTTATNEHQSHLSTVSQNAALAFFALTVFLSIVLLRPRRWHSEHELERWLARVERGDAPSTVTVASNFARYANDFRNENATILSHLQSWLSVSCLLLGFQIILWAVALATH